MAISSLVIHIDPRTEALLSRLAKALVAQDLDDQIEPVGQALQKGIRIGGGWLRFSEIAELAVVDLLDIITRPGWTEEMRRAGIDRTLQLAGYRKRPRS